MEEMVMNNEVVEETVNQTLPEVVEEAVPAVTTDMVSDVINEVPRIGIGQVIAVGAAGVAAGALLYTGGKWVWKKIKERVGKGRKYAKVGDEDFEDVPDEEFEEEDSTAEEPVENEDSSEK